MTARDPITGEPLLPGEAETLARLIARLGAMMKAEEVAGRMRRDAHVKMHGLMRAEFTVLRDLPPELRVGLFAQPATYRAWVRFSNAVNTAQPDGVPDVRGMAVKLMGVPGRKVLPGAHDAPTHDLIFVSTPQFPVPDVAGFDALAAAFIGDIFDKLTYFATHLDVLWRLATSFKRYGNPLHIRYFSCTPYAFGNAQVKYGARPRVQRPARPGWPQPENGLRMAAQAQLAEGDAVFDIGVQFRTDPEDMPLEDPTVVWDEAESPFRSVATLRVLPQVFDTDARNTVGENLSFSPWHCLPEHMPLGAVNRGRRQIYDALSTLRHDTNRAPRREPDDWED